MCGITGWVDFKKPLVREQSIMEKMTDTLSKRGPDDTNIWGKRHVLFGHKRLAVVDLEGGRQPMTRTHQGYDYTICYNGELYNTEDLRKELRRRGHQFKSHSDTEVLLHSYMEWKEECIDRLNGIFAFAVWDEKRDLLFAARDRLGVKPFFYTEQGSSFLFGSEIKAILAHPEVKAKVDRSGLAEIFGLGPSRSPGSGVFKGVKEIRPGHAMIFSKDGLTVWRYWNVKSEKHTDSFDETVENVRSLFQDAVTRHLCLMCRYVRFYLEGSIRAPLPQRPPSISREKGRRPFIRFRSIMKTMSNILRQAHFSQTPTARGLKKCPMHSERFITIA